MLRELHVVVTSHLFLKIYSKALPLKKLPFTNFTRRKCLHDKYRRSSVFKRSWCSYSAPVTRDVCKGNVSKEYLIIRTDFCFYILNYKISTYYHSEGSLSLQLVMLIKATTVKMQYRFSSEPFRSENIGTQDIQLFWI